MKTLTDITRWLIRATALGVAVLAITGAAQAESARLDVLHGAQAQQSASPPDAFDRALHTILSERKQRRQLDHAPDAFDRALHAILSERKQA